MSNDLGIPKRAKWSMEASVVIAETDCMRTCGPLGR
jgi:hypothetical protein